MSNAMLDARQEGDSYRRIEVITGHRRRRRTRRGHAHVDSDRQAQRRRSTSLARRCTGPDRRSQDQRSGRAIALELAPRTD
jgi:hypothetical protein